MDSSIGAQLPTMDVSSGHCPQRMLFCFPTNSSLESLVARLQTQTAQGLWSPKQTAHGSRAESGQAVSAVVPDHCRGEPCPDSVRQHNCSCIFKPRGTKEPGTTHESSRNNEVGGAISPFLQSIPHKRGCQPKGRLAQWAHGCQLRVVSE